MQFFSSEILFQLIEILVALTFGGYFYLKHVAFNYWKNKGISQADHVVPFGSMLPVLTAKKSIGEFLRDLYLQFKDSPVFGLYSFHKPTLVIRDPDLVRFVLTKEFSNFQDRGIYYNEEVDPLSGHLFMLSGNKWRNLRVKFSPTFTSGKMKHMFSTVKECSDNLVQCVADELKGNELIEIKELIARFTTDVIASVAFGIECNSLKNPDAEFRTWGRKILEPRPVVNALMVLCPFVLKLLDVATIDKKLTSFITDVFKETVEYRTANNIVRKDFLDQVMQLMTEGYVKGDDDTVEPQNRTEPAAGKITMLEGAAQVFVFWLAGFETSSSAATHCLYELAVNQDVQEKLADEISRVLEEHGDLTYDSINAMSYLHKVVSETLRKYPSLPTLNRECTRDIDLPGTGLRLTKGAQIVISVWGIHADPNIYPDPENFDPDRFNEENIAGRHRYAYLPFGEGPRNCIGMRFGLLQMKIGLVSLLSEYRFDIAPTTPSPLRMDPGNFLTCPIGGLPLRAERR